MKYLLLLFPLLCFADIDKPSLVKELRSFVKASRPNRIIGTIGHKKSRDYLQSQFLKLGGAFELQKFKPDYELAKKMYQDDFDTKIKGKHAPSSRTYKKWFKFTKYIKKEIDKLKNTDGHNFIWIKKAKEKSKDWLILMAHYDSISHDKKTFKIDYKSSGPGADYNGTGVASALQMAKAFKNRSFKKNLLILLPDIHSFGYLGAQAFINNMSDYIPKGSKISIFNLEMLGHDTETYDKKKQLYNYKVYTRKGNLDKSHIDILLQHNNSCKGKLFFDLEKNDFNNSDHVRFWEKGHSAITFSQNWEDDFNANAYQSDSDIVETINQDSFYEAFKYILCIASLHLTS